MPTNQRNELREWLRFVRAQSHVFNQLPSLLFQQAANQPDVSAPTRTARDRFIGGLEQRQWLRWVNKPQHQEPCLMTLTGHEVNVQSCAVSPDGRQIVSASSDKTLKIWNVENGSEVATLVGHQDWVRDCAYSPDGRLIVSASRDGMVKLWDARTGSPQGSLSGHRDNVGACTWSPDGRLVASRSTDGTLRLWEAETGRVNLTVSGLEGNACCCAFSPNGTRIVSGSDVFVLKAWDVNTGAELWRLQTSDIVLCCAYSPDGGHILTGTGSGCLKTWDSSTGREVMVLAGRGGALFGCGFSPDGLRIVAAGSDKVIKIWSAVTGLLISTFEGHRGAVDACVFSPDGQWIVSASSDYSLKIWGAGETLESQPATRHLAPIAGCAYSPEGERLASIAEDRTLKLLIAETGADFGRLVVDDERASEQMDERPSVAWGCAFSSDGSRLISWFDRWSTGDYQIRVWDVRSLRRIATLTGHTWTVTSADFSPDGRRVASVSSEEKLRIWDPVSGAQITERALSGMGHACRYAPSGRQVVTCSFNHTYERGGLQIWDVATGAHQITIPGKYYCCAYCPDGRRVLAGGLDGKLRIWNARTGGAIAVLAGHSGPIKSCAYSPDGRRILSVSDDNTIKLWDSQTATCTATLAAHLQSGLDSNIKGAVFSSDGKRVVSASSDETVRLFDAETGIELARFVAGAAVAALGIRPGGAEVAAGDRLGHVYVLRFEPRKPTATIVTAVRIWNFSRHTGFRRLIRFRPAGSWAPQVTAQCGWCGACFEIPASLRTCFKRLTIFTERGASRPATAWNDPGLMLNCPACGQLLRFNPFVVDDSGTSLPESV